MKRVYYQSEMPYRHPRIGGVVFSRFNQAVDVPVDLADELAATGMFTLEPADVRPLSEIMHPAPDAVALAEIRDDASNLDGLRGLGAARIRQLAGKGIASREDLASLTDEQIEALGDELSGITAAQLTDWRAECRAD